MNKIKESFKSPFWFTVYSTFIFGLAVHLFGIVNVLHNHDDISEQPAGVGTTLTSGRWFLEILSKLFKNNFEGNYNLPYFNGILFLILIAVSAGFLVSVFKIKNRFLGSVIGMILISFPSAVSTLFFKYTAAYYGLAILLSVLAVWFLKKYKFGFPLSCLCVALALGIYQAYLPLTASIFVLLLIKESLEEQKITFGKILGRGIYYCSSMLAGLILYYIILQMFLHYYDISLSSYQGISDMGNFQISALPGLIKTTYVSFFMLPLKDYCNLAQMGFVKFSYFALGIISIAIILWHIVKTKKNILVSAITAVLLIVFPVAVNLIAVMCPNSTIYTLMVHSFAIVLCVPVILIDIMPEKPELPKLQKGVKAVVLALLLSVICCYSYLANVNYTAMYYTNRQAENYLNSMVVQIRMTEQYDSSKKWAFIGDKIEDPLIKNAWEKAPMYGGKGSTYINAYSRNRWIQQYFGYKIPIANEETVRKLKKQPEVKEMPCWPDSGSIKVIDDTVVIKLQNE